MTGSIKRITEIAAARMLKMAQDMSRKAGHHRNAMARGNHAGRVLGALGQPPLKAYRQEPQGHHGRSHRVGLAGPHRPAGTAHANSICMFSGKNDDPSAPRTLDEELALTGSGGAAQSFGR